MKKILLTVPLLWLVCLLLPADEPMILLKNGEQIAISRICDHDQFGIMVEAGTDPKTKKTLRRFIPFTSLNPASLQFFPYCDAKVVERTNTAVSDRAELIMKKFKDDFSVFEKAEDLSKLLSIHSGVPSYRVFFIALSPGKNGTAGYLFSDSADCQFYGLVFLYGLLGEKNFCWTGDIYPEDRTVSIGKRIYPVFTVIPPQKQKIDENAAGMRAALGNRPRPGSGKMMPPPGGAKPSMQMPPPGGARPGMMPPPGGAKPGMMPPPGGARPGMMPPPGGRGQGGPRGGSPRPGR